MKKNIGGGPALKVVDQKIRRVKNPGKDIDVVELCQHANPSCELEVVAYAELIRMAVFPEIIYHEWESEEGGHIQVYRLLEPGTGKKRAKYIAADMMPIIGWKRDLRHRATEEGGVPDLALVR